MKLLDHITRIGDAIFFTYEVAALLFAAAVVAFGACLFVGAVLYVVLSGRLAEVAR